MITSDGCVVIQPAEGRAVRGAAGAATLMKADGLQTGKLLEAFEQAVPPGSGPPLHIHHDCAETLYILDGEFRFKIGSEAVIAPTGTFLFVPEGVAHTYVNIGPDEGRILFCFTPAADMASYFEELAEFPSGPPSDRVLDDIAARHGVEIIRSAGGA